MKQTLKTTAAILGIVAAVLLLMFFIRLFGCLMIDYADTCGIPL